MEKQLAMEGGWNSFPIASSLFLYHINIIIFNKCLQNTFILIYVE